LLKSSAEEKVRSIQETLENKEESKAFTVIWRVLLNR
jgi:hypothetical protein